MLMAKTRPAGDVHRNGAVRDRAAESGRFVDQKQDTTPFKGVRREILFPTEPSTIGHKKIDRAIERVIARKK
jgi:ABC-type nitrate/sulfonate/bicarbonate transport system ATPase subunit